MKYISLKRGFTLIELLVVIAIIGILASIVLVSLNSARAKGRDGRRLEELTNIAKSIAVNDNGNGVSFAGCGDGTSNALSACTSPAELKNYVDPSSTTACALTGALSSACEYAVSHANGTAGTSASKVTTQDWRVRTYLESGGGGLSAGGACISSATSTPYQCL